MLIIAQDHSLMTAMVSDHDTKFDQSQMIRIEAIASLNEAGKVLLRIQEKFKEAKASRGGMIETDLGEFKNFDDYLIRGSSVKKTQAYDYIKLAKNWDIVLALGMQDTTCSKTLAKSMRLCRTLKIISWYKECKKRGRPTSELTLEQYWLDEEARIQASKEARQKAEAELALLRVQVETTDVVPSHIYEQVSKAYQEKVAELEQTKKELEKANRKLAALQSKTYKFTPPTETPTRNPFVTV